MNATLQCLLHVSPLISYFINLYLNHYSFLQKINDSPSKGNISRSFYGIIESISKTANNKEKMNKISNNINARTTIHQNNKQWSLDNILHYTWNDYVTSTESPETLARVFLWAYERPGDPDVTQRQANARWCFDNIHGSGIRRAIMILLSKNRRKELKKRCLRV